MLTREQKSNIVEELKEKLSQKKIVFFVSFKGVNVKISQELRRSLKNIKGEYKVVKKTLLERASEELKLPVSPETMSGEVGLVFDYDSEVNAAKTLYDFVKKNTFSVLGGLMNDMMLPASAVKELALLPSLDIMRARVAFTIKSPISRLTGSMRGIQFQLINALRAVTLKKS